MKNNLLMGKAAEYRVASILLLQGHNVYFPSTDTGIDLIMDTGTTIQIKSAHATYVNKNSINPAYTYSFHSWKRSRKESRPHKLEGVDFIVCWAVDDDRFFIIPADEVRGKYSVRITLNGNKNRTSYYLKFLDRWENLFDSGGDVE